MLRRGAFLRGLWRCGSCGLLRADLIRTVLMDRSMKTALCVCCHDTFARCSCSCSWSLGSLHRSFITLCFVVSRLRSLGSLAALVCARVVAVAGLCLPCCVAVCPALACRFSWLVVRLVSCRFKMIRLFCYLFITACLTPNPFSRERNQTDLCVVLCCLSCYLGNGRIAVIHRRW